MKTRNRTQLADEHIPAPQPRLIKAGEVAAREAAQAVAEEKPKTQTIDPALKRTPRNANEARSMFEALFGDKAA